MSTFKPQFRPNTQDEFIWKEVYEDNCYRLPDDLTGITVIDVGANIGAFTIACLDRNAEAVYAYEPDRDSFSALYHNATSHTLSSRVHIYPSFVVGESEGRDFLRVRPDYETRDGVALTGGKSRFSGNGVPCRAYRIVDILSGQEAKIWIKLDCEGSEYEILLSNLPWERIERVFGECHTLMDGKLSRDTQPVNIDLGTIEASYNTIQQRLEEVGYHVEMIPNPEDPHLHLFFAEKVSNGHNILGGFTNSPSINGKIDPVRKGEYPLDAIARLSRKSSVCVLTPFRNARKYLPLYFEQMSALKSALEIEGMSLRIVAAEGDSVDGTRERLVEMACEYNIPLSVVDTTHGHMRWASVEDPVRMRVMSDVMNAALEQVRDTDDIVVWIMSDLQWEAEDIIGLINDLLESNGEFSVLSPLVFSDSREDKKTFYDTWAFRHRGVRFRPQFPYHDDFYELICDDSLLAVEVDSAGSCLVMRGITARSCRAADQEAVSFCQDVRSAAGCKVGMSTSWMIYHAPIPNRRILWISDAVCYSGFSRVAHAMFPQLSEAGYEIDIVALNYWGWPHNYPYTVWPANVNGDDPSGKLRMQMLVKSAHDAGRQYDAIVVLDDPWNIPGISAALENLERNHNVSPVPPVIAWVTVDGLNVNSDNLKSPYLTYVCSPTEFGTNQLGLDSTVPFGVDTSVFRPLDRTESRSLVSSKEVPLDAYIVGTVSTNQLRKRLDLVIAYFAEWVKNHHVDNAYLYLCVSGSSDSGCDIPSLIRYYGLQKRVILNTSTLNDLALAHVYSAFDVFLSLPLGEGFGMTALESMACGVPCVVSDNSGYRSWIPDDCAEKVPCTSTALSAPLNSQAYVIGGVADKRRTVAALHVLYTFPDARKEYSRKGLELARSMSWKDTGDKLLSVIEGVVTKSKSSINVPERKLVSI